MNTAEIAHNLMEQCARECGYRHPDINMLHWVNGELLYGSTAIYPPQDLHDRSWQAWKDYQGYSY